MMSTLAGLPWLDWSGVDRVGSSGRCLPERERERGAHSFFRANRVHIHTHIHPFIGGIRSPALSLSSRCLFICLWFVNQSLLLGCFFIFFSFFLKKKDMAVSSSSSSVAPAAGRAMFSNDPSTISDIHLTAAVWFGWGCPTLAVSHPPKLKYTFHKPDKHETSRCCCCCCRCRRRRRRR